MRFNYFATAFLACQLAAFGAALPDGVRRVKVLNYPDCFELANGDTRATPKRHSPLRLLSLCHKTIMGEMSLAELKESVLTLPQKERHDLLIWLNRLEASHGDIAPEALDQLAAEIWDQDDRHAAPTHPAR